MKIYYPKFYFQSKVNLFYRIKMLIFIIIKKELIETL